MSYGLCIVASKEGAIPEILNNGKAGIFIDPDNEKSFADTLQSLLRNPSQIDKLGNAAYQRFEENYTYKIFEERWAQIILKILG